MLVKVKVLLEALALGAVLMFGIASVKTFFRDGIPPGWDHPPHLVCSYLTSRYFFPRILGWDPYNNFGWVFNQFYNPGAYLLVALIDRAFAGIIDILVAYKIALVVTYLLPAVGAYALAKALGSGYTGATLAALLSLLILPGESEWLDAGLKQLYYIGMWPHRLGIGLALLALAAYWSALGKRGAAWLQRVSLASLLGAGAVLSHVMTGASLLIAETIAAAAHTVRRVMLAEGAGRKRVLAASRGGLHVLVTFLATVAGTFGLLAFWLVPLLLTNATYHSLPTISWYTGPWGFLHFLSSLGMLPLAFTAVSLLLSGLTVKRALLPLTLTAVISSILLWLIGALFPYDGYLGLRLLVAALFLLIVSSLSQMPGPAMLLSITSVLLTIATGPDTYRFQVLWWSIDLNRILPFSEWYAYYKFAGLARYLALTVAALGLSAVLERAYAASKRLKGSAAQLALGGFGLSLLLLVWALLGSHIAQTDIYYPFSDTLRFKMDTDFPGIADMVDVMEWVRSNVPDNTYVFYLDTLWKLGDWSRLPVSHYFYLSSMITGVPQVGGGFGTRYITQPIANTEADHLLGQPIEWLVRNPERVYEMAKQLGISYFVIFDNRLSSSLRARPELFEDVYRRGSFHVFRTTTFNPIVSIDEGEIVSVTIRPNSIVVRYRAGNATLVRVRQVYFPGWTAYVNGQPVHVESYYPEIPTYVWVPGDGVITNYRVPFIKVAVPSGENTLHLQYELNTWGDYVTLFTASFILIVNVIAISLKHNYYYFLPKILRILKG
ncbi:MAG: hypothetical protein QXO64_01780 [Thermofilaceae archaeon]